MSNYETHLHYCLLDENKNIVFVNTIEEWVTNKDFGGVSQIVKKSYVPKISDKKHSELGEKYGCKIDIPMLEVSTAFVGLITEFSSAFETMVFDGTWHDIYTETSGTWSESIRIHDNITFALEKMLNTKNVNIKKIIH